VGKFKEKRAGKGGINGEEEEKYSPGGATSIHGEERLTINSEGLIGGGEQLEKGGL